MEVPWEWSPPFVHSGKRYICSILSRSFCSACQSPAYPSTKGGSLSHPGSGEYFQRVVALSSSLAASDHNKLCTALWDCDTRRWKSSRGGWKSIIWNFCFFFLPDSMLLLCCRLPPSLPPIYCFEGFVSDSSFLIQLLSLFVTLFLPSLGSPSLLDLVCSSLLFLLCQAFALLSFSRSALLSHIIQTNKFSLCLHSSAWCYGLVVFPSGSARSLYEPFIPVPRLPNTCPEECQGWWQQGTIQATRRVAHWKQHRPICAP